MIELKNINKTYNTGKIGVQALRNVSFKIAPGEFVAIMGPSGSGKSTLLHLIGFLDRPDSGTYYLEKREVSKRTDDELAVLRNQLVGFVFQQFHLLPRLSALENVELPHVYAGKHYQKKKAQEKLEEVGLAQRTSHRPNELSGGEQQRIAIARSLVNDPLIILADEPTGNLDSKNMAEILSLLKNLNQKGKTIIIVTHEDEVAQYARRIVRMRDGEIVSDESIKSETVTTLEKIEGLSGPLLTRRKVRFTDHIRQAVQAITSHKMRSVLSMLGILIGVAAVIAMLAVGQGAKESISKSLASLGSNLLNVRPGSRQLHGVALEAGTVTRFTLQDAEAIARLPQVRRVSPSVSGRTQVIYGNKNWNTQVQGTGIDYEHMRSAIPDIGRFFTEEELRTRKKVALLGTTIVKELFGDTNPVGADIKINHVSFQVIGILPEKGATGWRDQDDIVVIPVTTAMYRLLGKEYIDSIDVEIRDSGLIEEAQEAIRQLIVRRHHIDEDDEDSFQIRNMSEIQEVLKSTTRTMSWLLGSIAAISLLVGGIGIMNIMLVSVTERTREIGLRKAIGARANDIMAQFLIESIVMTFSGGAIGIIFGVCAAMLLSVFAGWAIKVSLPSIVFATAFSIAVGLLFGLWPAQKASKLNPIEALRYE